MSLEHARQTEHNNGSVLDGYVDKFDLAQEFKVTPRTVDRWCERGFPFVQIGAKRFFNIARTRQHLATLETTRR